MRRRDIQGAHLTKEQFHTKFDALVDTFLSLPVLKGRVLKYELLFHNSTLDDQMQALGLPSSQPTVTGPELAEIAQDAKFKSLVAGEIEELGST
ncbi:hypothetical protein B0H17DRAFT_1214709 [Mycena rosella]|uniref:Uncharacterized protein n=1 Tax=Mycena rosella TaxID=1033263 RepID=A0AAD7CMG1_MYCRO|nr:hypothetical protein B0H17DRAFT_1214709 [Mycena rosella]